MEAIFENRFFHSYQDSLPVEELLPSISHDLGLASNHFYLVSNGRRVALGDIVSGKIHIILKTPGGKGGFGSMLRAIGAQIEKTTNREACRDLSGRRLRDINEEQRLKKWVAQQAEREKEAKEKKKKKLEKLLEQPRHEFKDEDYDKERSALPEKVEDAVLKGLEASCSTAKRKPDDQKSKIPKKKPKLWIDSELDEDLSASDSEEDNEPKPSTSCTQSDSSPKASNKTEEIASNITLANSGASINSGISETISKEQAVKDF